MFCNYLVTALRNLARHKLYSVINITGLAVGLACVIFVLLFIRDELSYDKWVPDTKISIGSKVHIMSPGAVDWLLASRCRFRCPAHAATDSRR